MLEYQINQITELLRTCKDADMIDLILKLLLESSH
jgi:hypothetical protein